MTITLTPEQQKWLESQVAAGRFASIEEAVRVAVADLMADYRDLAWAKPFVEKARESVARGKVTPGEEFLHRLDAKIAALRATT
jgi:Arc/MetJ-type ribon-helix-helix transcriptional regulator